LRYAVISDIHANLVALERVLEVITDHSVDRYLCLGDIVGYGARPNECCNLLQQLDHLTVTGNHDLAACQPGQERWFTSAAQACIIWTREVLTAENREFLLALPPSASVENLHICHASLADLTTYIAWPEQAMESFGLMTRQVCFFGHTHYAEWFVQHQAGKFPEQFSARDGARVELMNDHKYMINPGAVGQPRDGNSRAGFAICDTSTGVVELQRVEYDIGTAQEQIIEAGLPSSMAARLLSGI
jgi:diadenosine tetraphosphatase ApaH/serine/threonine PP2A family protein phosphatase